MLGRSNDDKLTAPATAVDQKDRKTSWPNGLKLSRLVVALLFVILLASVFAGSVFAQGGDSGSATGGPRDDSGVRLTDIARNYRERFPYAKEAANKDRVTDGQSDKGQNRTYKAYTRVRRKCFDGLGTMDGEKCDVKDGEAARYCPDECKEDDCPPEGKHCPDTPHYNWAQDQKQASVELPTARDEEAVNKALIPTKGLPMSDTLYQVIDRENKQRLLELMFDPERCMWTQTAMGHMQTTTLANSLGGAAEATFACALGTIHEKLINVAADQQSSERSSGGRGDTADAIHVVQKVYTEIFLPMALLLLLPGAVLTQFKGMAGRAILGADEDSVTPFTGITRAIIAGFLIFSVPLIVSYCIDTGNALADAVGNPKNGWVQEQVVTKWAKEQTYNPSHDNVRNGIPVSGHGRNTSEGGQKTSEGGRKGQGGGAPAAGGDNQRQQGQSGGSGSADVGVDVGPILGQPSGNPAVDAFNKLMSSFFGNQTQEAAAGGEGGGEGKAAGQLEGEVAQEDQLFLSSMMQVGFNGLSLGMGAAWNILAAYQVVFMCYLFLMGPIAACFYAWPSGVGKELFKQVFSNWLDAVVVLSLWRFWWCVILAVMTQRIIYLHPNPGSPSEMMVYNCFLALLLYIPFQPFNFKPGDLVSHVLEKAGAGAGGGSAGGGGQHGGRAGALDGDAGTTHGGASGLSAARQDSVAGRDMAAMAGGGGTGSMTSPVLPAQNEATHQVPAPPLTGTNANSDRAATGQPSAMPGVPSVPGSRVPVPPPPLTQAGGRDVLPANPALDAVRRQFPEANISAVASGMPPTVALAAAVPAVLLNTANPALAQAGMQAWSQVFPASDTLGGSSPDSTSTATASVSVSAPAGGGDGGGAVTAGSRQGISTAGLAFGVGTRPGPAQAPSSTEYPSSPVTANFGSSSAATSGLQAEHRLSPVNAGTQPTSPPLVGTGLNAELNSGSGPPPRESSESL